MQNKTRLILSGICFVGATFVAMTGNEGWGWLIFAGLCCIPDFE